MDYCIYGLIGGRCLVQRKECLCLLIFTQTKKGRLKSTKDVSSVVKICTKVNFVQVIFGYELFGLFKPFLIFS